jgi:hypothetical protein
MTSLCVPSQPHNVSEAGQRLRERRGRGRRLSCPRPLSADQEAFVGWFVAYWRRRGARLLAAVSAEAERAVTGADGREPS